MNKPEKTSNYRINNSIFVKIKKRKALFIVGNEAVTNISLIKTFNFFANLLEKNDFEINIKDHPNKIARLNENKELIGKNLSSIIPVEMIRDDYGVVIGCASTGLLKFKERSYSIVNLLDMKEEEKNLRKIHLLSLDNGKHINFIKKNFDSKLFVKKIINLYYNENI